MKHRDAANEAAFAYYPRLAKVRDHVERHLSDGVSLADAARVAGLEEKYFSTFFHDKTGVCFRDWITRVRIDKAARMMQSQDHPITSVGLAVGFHDLRTFERAFKKCMGETPSAYRKSVRPQ